MPSLLVRDGPQAGTTIDIADDVVLGRVEGDLLIEDPGVSPLHAHVDLVGGVPRITDLRSNGGTWVNGMRIHAPTTLRDADVIVVGQTSLEVRVATPSGRERMQTVKTQPTPAASAAPAPPAVPAPGVGRPILPPPPPRRRPRGTGARVPLVLGALIILGAAVGSIVYVSWPRTAAVTAPSGAAGQVNAEPCRRSIPDRAGPGHFLFSVSACENPAATVATLPLHRGTSRGRTVWYVVTDSSNAADAGQRGVNFAPKLARARATAAVQVVRETGGVIDFPATVDFRHTRVLVPGASGFPPADAAPPSVGEAGYSPLAQLPDGTVINAPQIANDTGHAARVVQLDTAGMRIRYRETVGWYADKHVHYASFDASSAIVAALEGVTLAPALDAAPRVDDEDAATSTREAMIAVTNGPTGTSNPSRQGLSSALVDKLDPDNILHETPVLPLHADIGSTDYSPMCDVRFAEWTRDAINAGDRGELQSFDAAMTRAGSTPPKVTGFQGVQFAAVGTLVNCSLISIDVP